MSFEALGLPPKILRILAEEGYNEPTPIQAESIPVLLTGRDLLGSAQTGTGKTAAFSLPLIVRLAGSRLTDEAPSRDPQTAFKQSRNKRGQRFGRPQAPSAPPRALILAPTRELAIQIQDSLRTYGRDIGLRQTVIVGGINQIHQERALRHGVDIIVATPGRLVDLMNQGLVDLSAIEVFILDEADRMFDLGFLPDMKRITQVLPAQRQNVMFSATMPGPLEDLAKKVLRDPVRVSIAPVEETTNLIDQTVCFVQQKDKCRLLVKLMPRDGSTRSIVFARTKHGADRIAEYLAKAGIEAEAMHGNKSQNARQRILARFKSARPQVLVATDLAARGIDVDAVSHVFNFDLPQEPETYVHRIGRTGRAGATGKAIAFCCPLEVKQLTAIERVLEETIPTCLEHSLERFVDESAPEKRSRSRRPQYSGSRGGYRGYDGQGGGRTGGRFARGSRSGGSRSGGPRSSGSGGSGSGGGKPRSPKPSGGSGNSGQGRG